MARKRLIDAVRRRFRVEDECFVRSPVKMELVEQKNEDESSPMEIKNNLQNSKRKRTGRKSSVNPNLLGKFNTPAMVRAERLQSSLGTESHSVIKSVVKSHVAGSYSFFLPLSFGRLYLPKGCCMVTILDENDEKFEVKYAPKWACLSSGWKKFAVPHKLREGDILVFHVIEPKTVKVYIIRADDKANVELGLSDPTAQLEQNAQGCLKLSDDPTDESKQLRTYKEFQIKINSLSLESNIDEKTLQKYYELCRTKNDILHNKLLSGLDIKLVAGIISETVKIVDAVKGCDIFTPTEKLEQWEKSLNSFKLLGMKVEFLVDRVSQLLRFRVVEGTQFDEIQNLEGKRSELKDLYEKVGVVIQRLKMKAEMHKVKFQEVIDSPW